MNDDAIDDIPDDIDKNDDYDVFIGVEKIEREDGVKRPRQPNKNLASAFRDILLRNRLRLS